MSYDISFKVKVEGVDAYVPVGACDANITWNVRKIIEKSTGLEWKNCQNNGLCVDVIPKIEAGLRTLEQNPDSFKEYEEPNGWGTVKETAQFFRNILNDWNDFQQWYEELVPVTTFWIECWLLTEATGLTPEEIKAPFTEDTMINLAAQALGVEPSRLRELAEADKDGRVSVLPCKVGDTVYILNRILGTGNTVYDRICARKIRGYGGNALNKVWLVASGDSYDLSIFPSEFGKTVFFTREEAEKALQEMEGKKDG